MNNTDKILSDIKELKRNSHPPIEFNDKLTKLHAKIDLLIDLLTDLSSKLSNEPTAPNPYGDDDFATPT